MILQKENNKKVSFGGFTTETSIDPAQLSKIKGVLSESLYSDKSGGSMIREITSNIVDAHIEHNVDKKGIIAVKSDYLGQYIMFQDFACGISPEFMKNYFSKFGWSSKETSNNTIGFFGLGRLSILSYCNKGYFITNVDGIKYTYELNKNNGASFVLISKEDTIESNGTTVKVYLKDNSFYEKERIIDNIKQHAVYFENIECEYFKNPLYKHETFWYSSDFTGDKNIHISYGGCYYKIPYSEFGIKPIEIPIALPIPIGKLTVPPNREQIDLTPENKKVITEALEKFKNYVKSVIVTEFDDLVEYYKAINNGTFLLCSDLYVKYSYFLSNPKFIFKPLKNLQEICNIEKFVPLSGFATVEKTKYENIYIRSTSDLISFIKKNKQILYKDKNYLNQLYFRQYVKNNVIFTEKLNLKWFIDNLNLSKVPKDKWRFVISEYTNFFKTYFNIKSFTEIKSSKEFETYVKNNRVVSSSRRSVNKETVSVARWSYHNDKKVIFERNVINTDKYIVINNKADDKTLNYYYTLIHKTDILMIKGKKDNFELIEELNIVDKIITSILITNFFDKYSDLINVINNLELYVDEINTLKEYKKLYYSSNPLNLTTDDFYQELIKVSNNPDKNILDILNKVQSYISDNEEFLKTVYELKNKTYYQKEFYLTLQKLINILKK